MLGNLANSTQLFSSCRPYYDRLEKGVRVAGVSHLLFLALLRAASTCPNVASPGKSMRSSSGSEATELRSDLHFSKKNGREGQQDDESREQYETMVNLREMSQHKGKCTR